MSATTQAKALKRPEPRGLDLLDLLAAMEPEGPRDPRLDVVHAVRPNMWGACGWCICGCAGASGAGWVLRRLNLDGVTCPDCIDVMTREPWGAT